MKRVEISITKGYKATNDIDRLIKTTNHSIGKPSFVSDITIEKLVSKLKQNIALLKEELIYAYDIYNTRWISDMYTKYDFNKGDWKDGMRITTFFPSGTWVYSLGELADIKFINDILDHTTMTDLAYIFDCDVSQIATSEMILRRNPEKYVILLDGLENISECPNLKYVFGNVILPDCSKVNLPKLEAIRDHANFHNLSSDLGLNNLRSVGLSADFSSLYYATGLINLESIVTDASFYNIVVSNGLNNLKFVGHDALFNNLTLGTNLTNLRIIGRKAYFDKLQKIDGLENLEDIGELGNIDSLSEYDAIKLKSKVRKLTKD